MRRLTFFFCLFIFLVGQGILYGQDNADTTTKVITISNQQFKDCIVWGKYIWVLQQNGVIIRIDASDYGVVDSISFPKQIVAIGKPAMNILYAADITGRLFSIDEHKNISPSWKTGQDIQQILFSSKNKCFLVTNKGIFEPEHTKKIYRFGDFYSKFFWGINFARSSPSAAFVDSHDNIWLGFDGGEWGGSITVFSTEKLKYLDVKKNYHDCYVSPVRSFFEIASTLYVTTSLQHFSIHSRIIKITNRCLNVFASPDPRDEDSLSKFKNGELFAEPSALYLGPSVYNSADSCIYFYCQSGVFKGSIGKDLSLFKNWVRVIDPNFTWYYGMPHAVGFGMNVSKLFFAGNKLFIVSPANGILILDNKKSVLLKTLYKPPRDLE
jgi:hypothetical protein